MLTAAVATQAQRHAGVTRHGTIRLLPIAPSILPLMSYFTIAGVAADRLSRPTRQLLISTPAQYDLKYEDVTFLTAVDHIPLSGWLLDASGEKVILMLHGRDQTRDRDEAFLEKASLFVEHGYHVLMFDFRGHGLSGGHRFALGAWETRDVGGALAYLTSRGYTEFGTYGVSMGAGISLLAAPAHPEIKALMVDSPYADLPALIRKKLPPSCGLPAFFNPGIFFMGRVLYGMDFSGTKTTDALAKLGDRPVFLVQSRDGDDDMPLTEGFALQQAGANDPNFTFWRAPGTGHVHSYTNNKEEYTKRMLAFYDKYLK